MELQDRRNIAQKVVERKRKLNTYIVARKDAPPPTPVVKTPTIVGPL